MSIVDNNKKDLNILIKDLPIEVDDYLNTLAAWSRRSKWMVIRDALCEYVEKHKKDLRK